MPCMSIQSKRAGLRNRPLAQVLLPRGVSKGGKARGASPRFSPLWRGVEGPAEGPSRGDLGPGRPQIQGRGNPAHGQDQSGKISSTERVGLGLRPNPTCGWRGLRRAPPEGVWGQAVGAWPAPVRLDLEDYAVWIWPMARPFRRPTWGRLAPRPPAKGPPRALGTRAKGGPGRGDAPQAGPPLETPRFSSTWGR